MKERITKNLITTVFGLMVWAGTIALLVLHLLNKVEMKIYDFILLAFLGYVFVMAKDTLIEGLTGMLLKIENKSADHGDEESA